MCNYHRPVCVSCEVDMYPEKNGIGVLDMVDTDPYKLWSADMWQCPRCSYQIIIGFGHNPVSEHYMPGFGDKVARYREHEGVVPTRSVR